MSLNIIFPITTKNANSKNKLNNLNSNDKYKQPHQAINLIPIYKNVSATSNKKRSIIDKSPENKSNESNNKLKFFKGTPINRNNIDSSGKEYRDDNSIGNDSINTYSSEEKKMRVPLQNINNNIINRNGILSAKFNEKKTKTYKQLLYLEKENNNYSNNSDKENKNHGNKILNEDKHILKADLEKVRISKKSFGFVEGYAAITTEGIVRGYNEDRVSIILNIPQPPNFKGISWPKCSFFGIYDGHGGSACADFLRDNLHKFIISDSHFPDNPQKAIVNGFVLAEKVFLQQAMSDLNNIEKSGSCAIIVLIIEKRCFISNVGDSRAILSGFNGSKAYPLSKDHRPTDEKEYARVLQAGGKIYQMEANYSKGQNNSENIIGPLRVMPGKLSVSRAFGNIEAKSPIFNGNPNVVIAKPDVKYFDINPNYDFVVIGCDGIFENMKNKDLIDIIWKNCHKETLDIHNKCGVLVESVINECINKKFTDNLTVVLISFKDHLYSDNDKFTSNTEQINKPAKLLELKDTAKTRFCLNSDEGKNNILPTPKSIANLNKNFLNNACESKGYVNVNTETGKNEILENILKGVADGKINNEKFISMNYRNIQHGSLINSVKIQQKHLSKFDNSPK